MIHKIYGLGNFIYVNANGLFSKNTCNKRSNQATQGNQEITFEWGLGRVSNNQAEALALFQGLKLLMQVISEV
jgi:ribonuclease HI